MDFAIHKIYLTVARLFHHLREHSNTQKILALYAIFMLYKIQKPVPSHGLHPPHPTSYTRQMLKHRGAHLSCCITKKFVSAL